MQKFDLIIIGGGPAGYNAAEKAAKAKLKTCLIEKRALGGVCLNEGCIPSKALLNSSKIYNMARHSAIYGITADNVHIDQKVVIDRKNRVVQSLVAGVGAKMKKSGVTTIYGEAIIKGKSANGYSMTVGEEELCSEKLLICTGSSAIVPPIKGVKEGVAAGFVLTNKEILALTEIPSELVVVGGGVIGLEMAEYYSSVGSKVTVIEMLDKIAGATDGEISKILEGNLANGGITFVLGAKVTEVGADFVTYEKDGKSVNVAAKKVLLSIGRRAVLPNGIEALGIAVDRGAIITDEYMRTNIVNVYAAGDCNGKSMLAHTAYREGEAAVNNMIGKRDCMRYTAIPAVIYTHPEVASVGETEETAKAKGYEIEIANLSMKYSGRYLAENENGNGICKVIVDKKTKRLLGVHIIGGVASESIFGAAFMIESEYSVSSLREIVFPHPSCSEVIRECLFELK